MAAGSSDGVEVEEQLAGIPQPFELRRQVVGSSVVVSYGGAVLSVYDREDRGMRNLAIVALTRAGQPGVEVAELFGVRPEHVSRLRRMADEGGSEALVTRSGRPRKLSSAQVTRVYSMDDDGLTGVEIAEALGVSPATISRRLANRPQSPTAQLDLDDTTVDEDAADTTVDEDAADTTVDEDAADTTVDEDALSPIERIGCDERGSAYAGAMLLHGFFDRAGTSDVLAALPSGSARRYDAAALILSTSFGFALGVSSAEGTKHLLGTDAGALVGLDSFPHLRTLRPRLAELADTVDPLKVQVALAKAMLDADTTVSDLFFVDDHFVAYSGSAPVAKGWNTRRRHAEPGRDDTVIVDDSWRAICFTSQPPSGLSKTMWAPLDQLRQICGERQITIGFDRGGSYPKVFSELNRRGIEWITHRRAPLAVPVATATRTWVDVDGHRHYLRVADELVTLKDVGLVRQISILEDNKVVLQILTSDLTTPAARLARRLRHRWCIENSFKYLEDHQGFHWLCDYRMDTTPDTAKVANPARRAAKTKVKEAQAVLAQAERALGRQADNRVVGMDEHLAAMRARRDDVAMANDDLEAAQQGLKGVPAKLPANELDPDATRATPRTNRRHLQMVCRLLAYNAELDLARAFNTYLDDPDEYRAITRNLLHQPGCISYTPTNITVTIRRPDAPRIARALQQLIDQLAANPPRLAGDRRPITYKIDKKS